MTTLINTILEHKWGILLICEVSAWLLVAFMIYFRYFVKNKLLFWISTAASVLLGYVPHIAIPFLIAFREGSVHALYENKGDFLFVLAIVAILVAGVTLGKKYIATFDRYMFQLAEKRQIKS